jgi:hypothetical protein
MIDHLSPSSIEQFLRCSWQWKLQRVDKIPSGVSWPLVAGSIVHEVAAWNFLHKVESKKDLPLAQLAEHAQKVTRKKIDETPLWHTTPGGKLDEDLKMLETRVEVCVKLFAENVAPFIQPIEGGIEKKLIIPAGDGFPDILCILDCIDVHGVIHDFKTTHKSPSVDEISSEIHRDIQPSAYGLAYRIAFGKDSAEFRFHYMVDTAHPKAVPVTTSRMAASYVAFLRRAQQVWKAHQAGVYLPAEKGWGCSEGHCWYALKGNCEFYVKYH